LSQTAIRSADHATITINTPEGPVYIQSVDPNKVEIGSINIGDDNDVEINTRGSADIGEINVGATAVVARNFDKTLESDNGALAITVIASVFIALAVLGVLGWRALSQQSHQRR
jgi:carbonic anhydrase/acetyltransferase-like protein (isoleucine patch superfamily)